MLKLRWLQYAMISPVQIALVAIILLPSIYVLWLSFNQSSFGANPVFVGLDNYVFILSDPIFWRAVVNTLVITNGVVFLELVFGVGLALLMTGWVPGKRVVISLLLLPYAVTEVSAVVMWRFMLQPDVGLINYTLQQIGLPQLLWATDRWQAMLVITVLTVWLTLPFTFLIIYSALLALPRELIEAAVVDGANRLQVFWRVIMPTIMPAVLIALVFRYIFALRLFSEVWLLTGGGPARRTEVVSVYLYRYGFRYNEFGVASAAGWIILILSFVTAIYYVRQMYRRMFRDA